MKEYGLADLDALIAAVRRSASEGEVLYLVASTSHLAEGWRDRVPRFELGGESGGMVEAAVREAGRNLGFPVVWETPQDVIPLPPEWQSRCLPAPRYERPAAVPVVHFDPYSVVLRLVARGDESDYVASLEYLARGWVELPRLEALLGDLLPRFTNATLAQDPAEFRRKFRGLRQLRLSVA